MNYNSAITSGNNLLVIKNDRVIGKASVTTKRGSEVSVRFTEGEIVDLIKDLELVKSVGLKYSYFRFLEFTGGYGGTDQQTGAGGDDILWDVSVVDEFNFRWGMVPEHFSCVPGYRDAEEE